MNSEKKTLLICLGIIVGIALIYLYPIIFKGLYPGGTDVVGSLGETYLMEQITSLSGERSMWNPAIFSGMPTYYSWYGVSYNLDTVLVQLLAWVVTTNALYFFVGAIGIFFLMRHFDVNPYVAAFTAIAFLFLLHYQILFQEGHFKKFRAVMMLPFVTLSFLKLLDRPTLFTATFYILVQSVQIRTLHYQIIFYTAIVLLALGLWKLYEFKKNNQPIIAPLLTFLASFAFVIAIVSQPLFVTKEYAPYSIRGSHSSAAPSTTNAAETVEKHGLDYDYATNWSLPPSDMVSFLVPRFKGGGSGVIYDGNNPKYKQMRGRMIRGYWGDMPFTASSEYVGVVILFFFICGVYFYRKSTLMRTLLAVLVFSSLLSFGKYFPLIYDLFFNNMPFFNQFRSPMMILVIVDFLLIVVAGFGLHALVSKAFDLAELKRGALIAAGTILGALGLIYLVSFGLDLASAGELAQMSPDQIAPYKEIRLELLQNDVTRSFLIALCMIGVTFLYLNDKLKNYYALAAIAILLLDMYPIAQRYMLHKTGTKYTHLNPLKGITKYEHKLKPYDSFLLQQKRQDLELAEYRLYPVDQQFWQTNAYSFVHQSIGGYNAAKMRIYQDLADYGMGNRGLLSRNIVNMLNARYLYSQVDLRRLNLDSLNLVFQDGKDNVFENTAAAGRAWFVGQTTLAKTLEERFALLNSTNFDIRNTAILEEPLTEAIAAPVNASVTVEKLGIHGAEYSVKNEATSLLVLSEVYYPIGWTATIDGVETPIHKTNHVLRSIVVPKGEHNIKLTFYPETLKTYLTISNIVGPFMVFLFFLSALLFIPQIQGKVPEKIRKMIV